MIKLIYFYIFYFIPYFIKSLKKIVTYGTITEH